LGFGLYFYIGLHKQFAAFKDPTNPANRTEFAQIRLGRGGALDDSILNTFEMLVLLTDES